MTLSEIINAKDFEKIGYNGPDSSWYQNPDTKPISNADLCEWVQSSAGIDTYKGDKK